MYVCVCHAVTEREIRAEVARGSNSIEAISMALGVATCCGACRATASELIGACASANGQATGEQHCADGVRTTAELR